MEIRSARPEDVEAYVNIAKSAQEWLHAKGLRQYVPAAHEEAAGMIRSRVEVGSLYAAWIEGSPIAFFGLDAVRSPWWPPDDVAALYIAGMVVAPSARGRRVGNGLLQWCVSAAECSGCRCLRLDCHAGNPRLRLYYETRGFTLQGKVEQQPGYGGCLYQFNIVSGWQQWFL